MPSYGLSAISCCGTIYYLLLQFLYLYDYHHQHLYRNCHFAGECVKMVTAVFLPSSILEEKRFG